MDILLQLIANGVLLGGVFALISIGLTLIFGIVRVVNFAHGELLMVGLYATWIMATQFGLHPYVAALPLAVAFFFLGALMQRAIIQPLMNADPHIQIFATVGVGTALANAALMIFSADLRSVDLPWARQATDLFGLASVSRGNLVAFAVSFVATGALIAFLNRTHLGRAIRAVAQNRYAAPLMGIDVNRIYAITFGIGAGCVGLAAAVLAPLYPAFPTVGSFFVLTAFVVVVLGGMGSLEGAVVGALIIGLVESLAGYYVAPDLKEVVYFVIFLGILIVRPAGLFGVRGNE
ncbi:branched-chain amino acid ABC transporter permease [Roseomonas eburnea]|uniref:Branched-chain amino acid ABC transporter permease n=1 Tax=Neoroseomonas eburnea TaxID=1346889 RepID=A0A9X9XFS1_9PROT|nr:branched-chain amino acid ABC transporter permease [Neoroseomonas eburnea]MBR0682557.1 branched-chain amino acid ABC transporter permease [Neoroseomonas eburnea]